MADSGEMRIISLVPSITELLCDLGLAERLVGRTGFCIHPWETVRRLPKVGGTKDLRMDRIRALRPTHVVVNVDENRREDADTLREFVPHVVVTHPCAPLDNLGLYRHLGAVFDRRTEAAALCARFRHEYETAARLSAGRHPRTVLYLIWREPWMTVSRETYISRTLGLFGWQTVPAESDARYPEIAPGDWAGRVDHVLLSSEPYHFKARHIPEVTALVPGATVSLIDGEMTSWYGSRAIHGLRYLTRFTAPEHTDGDAAGLPPNRSRAPGA